MTFDSRTESVSPAPRGRHLICLTIDTDPDGLAGPVINRETLQWRGLDRIDALRAALDKSGFRHRIPITWFVRADGQLRDILGTPLYLLERFENLWRASLQAGDEIGWHPHLYRQATAAASAQLIHEPHEAAQEIEQLWHLIRRCDFQFAAFRNGEGWHNRATFDAIERLGFRWDSTAIPGRKSDGDHPLDWIGSPNHPFFPNANDIRLPGPPRNVLEIPMTTWLVKAPYDKEPRLRYINPAIHRELFEDALERFRSTMETGLQVWTMIMHPDEITPLFSPDQLYARDVETVCHNLHCFADAIEESGQDVAFVTISTAGAQWRRSSEPIINLNQLNQ